MFLLFSATVSSAATTSGVTPLPPNTFANAIQIDAAGNLYLAGSFFSDPSKPTAPAHAFVAKLSPDASQILWSTPLGGSQDDRAVALALGPGNTVYVTGSTQSPDFPTTKSAFATTGNGFAAKLDATGAVVYSTYIPAATAAALTVDPRGDAFITGIFRSTDTFVATAGSVAGVPFSPSLLQTGYVLELDPSGGRALLVLTGFGGASIALDPQGNIYTAGAVPAANAPTTAGAFQSSVSVQSCGFSSFFGITLCGYQYVAKIDPTGTKLIYATYIAGTWGAYPIGLVVDSAGNAILAGSTTSPDYPTTPAAYQPVYFPNPALQVAGRTFSGPPTTGFVTKLNATGTGLLWSTFLGGSGVAAGSFLTGDTIAGMAMDAGGNILLAGFAASPDFPGLWNAPVSSRPLAASGGIPTPFAARLSTDGGLLSPVQLLNGLPGESPALSASAIAVRPDGTAVLAGVVVASLSFSSLGRVTMIADPADNAKVVSVAPGQLLTLYGGNLALPGIQASPNGYPSTFAGLTVTFNGIAAPLLFTAGNQINLEVPYEIAGKTQVTMQVSSLSVSPPVSESYTLAVAPRQPSVFVSLAGFGAPLFDIATCNGKSIAGVQPLALNSDGSANTCANPATAGSAVTIFLNGLGVTNPSQTTGAISLSMVAISPAAVTGSPAVTLPTGTIAGLIADVVQVQLPAPSTSSAISLVVSDSSGAVSRLRGPGLVIWVKAP